MQNLLEELKTTLESDERLIIDGQLVKNKVVELALAMDAGLITLLLRNESIKEHFFKAISGALVFDKVAFQSFVSNKQFLQDSYTAFKNKIGLTANGEYLTESKEVVLAWPYKDCVLEGGQTREDQKRKEIFWNETLAPDEIDRLLAPKALTNFKKYDKDGEHEVKDISLDDNLIIKGNNLLALHSLKKQYAGKVKLIYIDPPYNTGNDSFCYNDSFNHSTWLTFLKNRLEIAKVLLSETGTIYMQLDYNEIHYAKIIMDEIFGRENFQSQIAWKRTSSRGDSSTFGTNHDIILFYSKSDNFYFKKTFTEYDEKYLSRYKHKDDRGIYLDRDLTAKGLKGGGYNYRWNDIDGYWRCPIETMSKLDQENRIYYTKNGTPRMKQYLHEMEGKAVQDVWNEDEGNPVNDIWDDINVINSQSVERVGYSTQKPEMLLKRILESSSSEGDLVLDFFMGSATTQAVAHKMKRRFIGIEQMIYVDSMSINRLQSVVKGEETGISKDVNWQGGGSFIYCELAQHNANVVDKIEKANTTEALKLIWQEIEKTDFISYKIKPEIINENSHEFEALTIEEQKQFLIAVLDKNQLYVNYSEIEDEDYQISDEDKKLNKQFYGDV